ncbi:RNA polymerase sigma factor [Gilvibacter sp.]|uniref:RNA polymerase sigma factor n=1 Tax=Gilvibacter sp. TaxID=2729997 RepID=UPI003F4A32C9
MEINEQKIASAIEKALKGDQIAFNTLLNTYWNQVYGFQLKRLKDEYEAEEITIQTFSKAFDKLSTYNPKYAFNTWLITISKNLQIDKSRKKNNQPEIDRNTSASEHLKKVADNAPTAEDKLITEQNLAELLAMIKQLKPHYQEVINLRYFQEKSYNEISDAMEESLSNVKVKLLRAKNLLATLIKSKRQD